MRRLLCILMIVVSSVASCFNPSWPTSSRETPHKNAEGGIVNAEFRITPAALPSSNTSPPSARPPVSRLVINDETIEAAEIWRGLQGELAQKAQTLSPAAYRNYLQRRAVELIRERITETLLYQKASLRIPPQVNEQIEQHVGGEIRKIVTTAYGGVQRRYEKHLQTRGQTVDRQRAKLQRRFIIARYLDAEVRPKVAEPTREELWTMFQASRDSWRRPPRRRMSLIDVRVLDRLPSGVDNPSREQLARARQEARARIEAAKRELVDGTDFTDVARRYSDGLSADEGGGWGWISRGSVRKRYEPVVSAVFALRPGEVGDIIEVDDGFFLVRCNELDPGVEPDFQTVQLELKERYLRATFDRKIMSLVEELRRKAHFEPPDLDRFVAAVVEAAP